VSFSKINLFRDLLFLSLLAASCPAQVQLTLQAAVQQALSTNPQLDVAQGRIEDAKGLRVQAGLGPNPRLTLQSEDMRAWQAQPRSFATETENYAYVGQTFEVAGKRARRVDLASTGVHRAEYERELLKRQIRARVSAAYWNAVGAARTRDLLRESLRTYEDDVNYSRNRVQQGVMAETDLMRVQLERDRVRMQLMTADRDADQTIVELYRAMGKSEFPPTTLADLPASPCAVILPDLARVLEARPEMQIAREAVAEAESNIRLQHAASKPDPEAFLGYKRNLGLDTVYAAVQVDLPFRNRNQGNIAAAQAQLHMAQANLRAAEAGVKADLTSAERVYLDQRKLLETLPETQARAEEAERLARAAFREGGIPLLRLLDAERYRIDMETQYSRALVDLQQSIVNLEYASGEEAGK
jgi:outer membrane protein, heavy metal efflux system